MGKQFGYFQVSSDYRKNLLSFALDLIVYSVLMCHLSDIDEKFYFSLPLSSVVSSFGDKFHLLLLIIESDTTIPKKSASLLSSFPPKDFNCSQ